MTRVFYDAFSTALQASWELSALVSLLAGVASHHLIFRPFEIDGYAWQILFIFLGSVFIFVIAYIQLAGYGVVLALCRVSLIATAYSSGAAISIFMYRAFLHPLNRFPGPFLAKISRFYAMNNAAKNVKAFEDIRSLHKKYGDIVRVGKASAYIHMNSRKLSFILRKTKARASFPSIARLLSVLFMNPLHEQQDRHGMHRCQTMLPKFP